MSPLIKWDDFKYRIQLTRLDELPPSGSTSTRIERLRDWTSRQVSVRRRGERQVYSTRGDLDAIHKRISKMLEDWYSPPVSVYGFVKGRSTADAASVHIRQKTAFAIDLRHFYDQVNDSKLLDAFSQVCDTETSNFLLAVCSLGEGLPIGFRTSPTISNMALFKADSALLKYCEGRSLRITRWADDMTISGDDVDDDDLNEVANILNSHGWALNERKTRFMNHDRVILGLNAEGNLTRPHIRRSMKRSLRQQVHFASLYGDDHFRRRGSWSRNRLMGTLSYVESIDPELAQFLRAELSVSRSGDPSSAQRTFSGTGWQHALLEHIGIN